MSIFQHNTLYMTDYSIKVSHNAYTDQYKNTYGNYWNLREQTA
jgi:hypothetical protein